ncbi:MAG: glycosyltransferase family 4 protein [Opitutales bacterium]|nr:glycosyltransferase family 4 protein [Opitutales bacterium]
MADRCRYADAMLAPSKSYARMMEKRMGLESGSISVHPNGINLEGYSAPREVDPPAIGFLARMCEVKGLGLLVDAFIHLRTDLGDTATRLKIAGAVTLGDVSFIDNLKAKLESAGLTDSVDWHPNISREEKLEFLNELSLFSVPVLYEEAFGLYAIEAMAASVPIVQPDFAAFPELVEATGGGVCVSIETADGLARAYDELLRSPELMKEMGERGRLGVEKRFSMEAMKNSFINAMESLLQSKSV